MSRKGPQTRYLRWWRGQDLNLRPSGYEPTSLVPAGAVERPSALCFRGFRPLAVPSHPGLFRRLLPDLAEDLAYTRRQIELGRTGQ